ncbi:MAG: S-layer homology domain-containing protein [Thermoleophilia bacterium]
MVVLAFDAHDAAVDSTKAPAFPDVPYMGDAYLYDFVEEAHAAGYVNGFTDGTFRPFDPLTRVQLVRILVAAAGTALAEPPAGYDPGFTDLDPADAALVAKAEFNGLVDGKTPTTFDPYGTATRGHVAKILHNLLTM